MAIDLNNAVQTILNSQVDAISLSEFMWKPADYMVIRRLAPSIHTLNYYINRLNSTDIAFSQAVSNAIAAANASQQAANLAQQAANTANQNAIGLIDSVTTQADQAVRDAIEGVAIDANLVTDALIKTVPQATGGVARNQASKNADIINIKDFLDLDDPSIYITGHQGKRYIDHYAALIKAEASVRIDQGSIQRVGATIHLGDGDLWFSETVNLKSTTRIIGNTNATGVASATICRFPPGKDGFILNRHNTDGPTGTIPNTKAADGASLIGIDVVQDGYVRTSSPVIDYNPTHKLLLSNEHGGLVANTIAHCYDDRLRVKMSAKIANNSGTNNGLRAVEPSRYIDIPIGTSVTGSISGAVGTIAYAGYNTLGYVIKVTSGSFVVNDVVTYGVQQFTINYVSAYKYFRIYSLTDVVGGLSGADKVEYGDVICDSTQYGTGIRLRARGSLHQCKVTGFPHYGVLIATDGNMVGNANCFDINVLSIGEIGIHGIMTLGGDSNAGAVVGLNVNACTGYGVKEYSFLGNHYFSSHASYHGIGAYFSKETINSSAFVGCYSESGANLRPFPSSSSRFGKDTTIIGGKQGAGVTTSGGGFGYLGTTNFRVANAIFMTKAGVNASGNFNDSSLALLSSGVDSSPLTLIGIGNKTEGNGVKVNFRLPAETTKMDKDDDLLSSKEAGVLGVVYNAKGGSSFNLALAPTKSAPESRLLLRGGGATRVGSVSAVIEGGAVTKIIIHDGGTGYTSEPTLEGLGEYVGLLAKVYIFNGKVQSLAITQNITGATDTKLVDSFEVNDKEVLGAGDGLSSLGNARRRFYKNYSVLGSLTTSTNAEQVNPLAITDGLLDAWAEITTSSYQSAAEVAKIGAVLAITHFGYNAETIYNILNTKSINALKLGIVERTTWRENNINYVRWFVNTEQCVAVESAYQRRRMGLIEARLLALETP